MTFWTALALATAVANPYVGTDVSGNLHVNSTGATKVFVNGIDVLAELEVARLDREAARLDRIKAAALNATVLSMAASLARLDRLTSADMLQRELRVAALEVKESLVNETALEERLADLEDLMNTTIATIATLGRSPAAPADWAIALFFEGVDGEVDPGVLADDSAADVSR